MGDNYSYIQSQRIQKEKQYWTKLRQLSDNDNVKEFYQLYMEYLEWSNILSSDRKAIYKMAKKIAENN
jgi:hypothetical protein